MLAATHTGTLHPASIAPCGATADDIDFAELGSRLHLFRRRIQRKQHLFRAGQPFQGLHLVHAGQFATSIVSEDGHERITGFRLRGDLLGIDALGTDTYTCDAVALDIGEVWDLPAAMLPTLTAREPALQQLITSRLAAEIRRDWRWMLKLSTLRADQRVAAFLLELADHQQSMGFSARHLMLRMTRAELGSFLSLQLETVTRALTRFVSRGLIQMQRREITLLDTAALRTMVERDAAVH